MKISSCVLVGLEAEPAAIAREALQGLYSELAPGDFPDLAQALEKTGGVGSGILILQLPPGGDYSAAARSLDQEGLPRWAILALGQATRTNGAHWVEPSQWTRQSAARELRVALHAFALARENARLRGDLLTIGQRVAHDLRTPLGGIVTTGEVLKELLEDRAADARLVQPLFESADELGKLITRMSLLLKATANPLPKEPVEMGAVAWAGVQRNERRLAERKMKVVTPKSWPEIEGVTAWLEAIWSNLIENARKFGREGTTVELGAEDQDGQVRFWVRNEGEPVPEVKRAKLFQPFHLLHQPSARKGIGLSIVQRLVELQGGACAYEAQANGSEFSFTLPK